MSQEYLWDLPTAVSMGTTKHGCVVTVDCRSLREQSDLSGNFGRTDVPSILVVDDDQAAADSFTAILRHFGYDVMSAASGSAALELLSGGLPDLVILDVMMPDMNGLELLRCIRSNFSIADLPVVMYSALDNEQWRAQARDAGANDYWIKGGFDCGELEEKVRSCLPIHFPALGAAIHE